MHAPSELALPRCTISAQCMCSGTPYDIHTIDNQYYVLGNTKGGLISELFFTLAQIFQKRCQKTIFRTIQLKREDSYDSDMANFFWRFFFKAKNLRLSHL